MHESAMALSILHIVEDEARRHDARHIREVRLRLGVLTAVETHALAAAFEIVSEGSIADSAKLTIERTPVQAHCKQCGADFALYHRYGSCTVCQSHDLTLSGGMECVISGIEADNSVSTKEQ